MTDLWRAGVQHRSDMKCPAGLTKKDSGSHDDHHPYIAGALAAAFEGHRVRLSANGDAAALLEEERGGEPLAGHRP
ncbi:hypothetical protein [Salinarimonas soli]|uniref:Uncharacterized protein n=1 Tax=Salinarimonas soli TaxID=1638099 RepID=A0A5B2VI95_9HYPH|nr:hypothetical protein [Salinarimonas soli]KAA2238276.1 hypothetical protein F0L46_06420 [Salinarimonas soli]